jgi:hypothetical protein
MPFLHLSKMLSPRRRIWILGKRLVQKTDLNGTELATLLKWKMGGKNHTKFNSKPSKQAQWEKVKNDIVAGAEHPGELPEYDVKSIPHIDDTLLGRRLRQKREELIDDLAKMEDLDAFVQIAKSRRGAKKEEGNPVETGGVGIIGSVEL